MNERSQLISKLRDSFDSRTAYIKSKLGVLVPSQVRALRLQSEMPRQKDLAIAAHLHQSRISMFETPGMANITLETLAKLAAAFRVGVVVKFVPFSEMLRWENEFSQDSFIVTKIDADIAFENPAAAKVLETNQTAAKLDRSDDYAERFANQRIIPPPSTPDDMSVQISSETEISGWWKDWASMPLFDRKTVTREDQDIRSSVPIDQKYQQQAS